MSLDDTKTKYLKLISFICLLRNTIILKKLLIVPIIVIPVKTYNLIKIDIFFNSLNVLTIVSLWTVKFNDSLFETHF